MENCVTAVFSAYVTTSGQAWADFDVYMPDRWAKDPGWRRAAGIRDDLVLTTKPDRARTTRSVPCERQVPPSIA